MGLDITAYGRLTPIDRDRVSFDEDGFICSEQYDIYQQFYIDPEMSDINRNEGIVPGQYYDYGKINMGFRAGSYSSYGQWRGMLHDVAIRLAGEHNLGEDEKNMPFYELIFFSDCEGVIGPVVSEKLYHDFVSHKNFVTALEAECKTINENMMYSYFVELYDLFTNAFDMARNQGAVAFH